MPGSSELSRRSFLGLTAAALATVTAGCSGVERAHRVDPGSGGSLGDIDHFVLLMQENRSFDHYFGTMSGVRGFDDPRGRFDQPGYRHGRLAPFRYEVTPNGEPEDLLVSDPDHSWTGQHAVWNHGRLDAWMRVHSRLDGTALAPAVMGYFTRADLPVHYALADAFTVCDNYFCSSLGPTGPNRMFWMTGGIDVAGKAGGPITGDTADIAPGRLTWPTFPEVLQDAGVSWKVYNALRPQVRSSLTGMLKYFRNFQVPGTALHERGLLPSWPGDFVRDVRDGTLPAVSWIIPSMALSEHPDHPPAVGAEGIMQVLNTLTANPAVWERTALIVSYDENGGFFDHVPPPVAPVGTEGEYVSAQTSRESGVTGLGFRVPCLVISPYSRGGLLTSQPLDHTSQLRLVGARFGVPVPNLSAWRREIVGDFTNVLSPTRAALPASALPSRAEVLTDARRADTQLRHDSHEAVDPVSGLVQPAARQERLPIRRRV